MKYDVANVPNVFNHLASKCMIGAKNLVLEIDSVKHGLQ
jgi:hypothetical protein